MQYKCSKGNWFISQFDAVRYRFVCTLAGRLQRYEALNMRTQTPSVKIRKHCEAWNGNLQSAPSGQTAF
eukprot:2962191-Amphidinium_carterae.1